MPTDTLLLRLDAPIQSWGDATSRWDYRTTGPRPTKSAVIGLIANTMGRHHADPIDDLAALRFAVRADRPGHTELDLRTAGAGTFPLDSLTRWNNPTLTPHPNGRINYGAPRASANNAWTPSARTGIFRTTTYLADAAFLASLTGDRALLTDIQNALTHPARLIYLGRRAHPPATELHHATLDGDHHTTWINTEPLLPNATTPRPHAWTESPLAQGVISYEQPATGTPRGGPHRPTRITHTLATPPATTPGSHQ